MRLRIDELGWGRLAFEETEPGIDADALKRLVITMRATVKDFRLGSAKQLGYRHHRKRRVVIALSGLIGKAAIGFPQAPLARISTLR